MPLIPVVWELKQEDHSLAINDCLCDFLVIGTKCPIHRFKGEEVHFGSLEDRLHSQLDSRQDVLGGGVWKRKTALSILFREHRRKKGARTMAHTVLKFGSP